MKFFIKTFSLLLSLGCSLNAFSDKGNHLDFDVDLAATKQKICLVGDTGTGKEGQWLVAQAMEKLECDQIRILGDIIYESGLRHADSADFQNKFYLPYENLMKAQVPFFMVLGNHDHLGKPDAWMDVATIYSNVYFPERFYSERWNDVCFVTFDTDPFYQVWGWSSQREQKKWVRELQEKLSQDCRFSVALGHHPYLSVGEHGDAFGPFKGFAKKNILGIFDFYAAGHDHNLADEGEIEGTRLVVSGAGAKLRDIANPRAGHFSLSELGLVVLEFSRENESETLLGHYKFYTVKAQEGVVPLRERSRPFNEVNVELVYEGQVKGQGLRSKE